jgi:hypothetical protein
MGEQIRGPSSHHIRPRAPIYLLPVGCPVQPSQHPACSDDSIPPEVKQDGRTLPPPPQGRTPGLLRHDKLVGPPTVGPAWPPHRLGSVRLTTHFPGQFLDSPELPSKFS